MNPLSTVSDHELISLFIKGDEAAYTEIYNRFKGILHLHAYKKLGNLEEAKDVVQELFTAIWNNRNEMPQTDNLSGYLYQSLRNRIFNMIAHKKVEAKYIDSISQFFNEGYVITDHLVREKELHSRIEAEISNLPLKMQQVFLLSRKSYLSHKEIAEKLSISESTVKNQIKNALKILRSKLGTTVPPALFFLFHKF
jgi:RNA polymerase sigma-70 factor (ECF subfamily)